MKNEIIRANLRLVVAIAKRYARRAETLFEMISDGNIAMIRAVEKFDYARGFKFSTYATWAIIRNFAQTIPLEHRHRTRFLTGAEEVIQTTRDERTDQQWPKRRLRPSGKSRSPESWHASTTARSRSSAIATGWENGREPMTLKEVGGRDGRHEGADPAAPNPGHRQAPQGS